MIFFPLSLSLPFAVYSNVNETVDVDGPCNRKENAEFVFDMFRIGFMANKASHYTMLHGVLRFMYL